VDFDEYVAARYGRLIEHAVLLGCPEGEAGTYVDRVLLDQRRRIRRSDDPDPVVRTALERALSGEPERRHRAGPIAALATVAGVAVLGLMLTYRPAPDVVRMPSLFGYDAEGATTFLDRQGFEVRLERVRACEPLDQVIGSQPMPGTKVEEGSTVIIKAALPTDEDCIPNYDDRVDAWAFIRFAIGGPAPRFGPRVRYDVLGGDEQSLTGDRSADPAAWGEVLTLVSAAAHRRVARVGGLPALAVTSEVPPSTWCGRDRPPEFHERTALRLVIDTRPNGATFGCPLTVDLYRRDRLIDGVVVYPELD
jgi:hypothetical protein